MMVPQDAVKVAGSLAVNCWVAFSATLTWVGETVMGTAAATVSFAVLVYAGLPVAIAVMVQIVPWSTDALKRPVVLMLPQEAVQTTDMLAVNCCVCPEGVEALAGEIVRGEVTVTVELPLEPVP